MIFLFATTVLWFSDLFGILQVIGRQAIHSNSTNANSTGPIITPEFSDFVSGILNTSNISGLSLTIVRNDVNTEYGSWGRRTESGDPVTPTTLFHLASCSKAFLVAAFGILMEDFRTGKNTTALPHDLIELTWHTKVKDIIPAELDWGFMEKWTYEKVNIMDILSHMSGLPRHDLSYGPKDHAEDMIRRMKYLRPTYELRQQWSYNNIMYMLSAHIISHYTGSCTSFVKDRIFDPLNMTLTTFYPSDAVSSGEMTQAWTKNGRRIPQWFTDEVVDLTSGPGGVISNGEDIGKWIKTLLHSGIDPSTNTTIIPRSVFDAMTTPHAVVDREPGQPMIGYGMGWMQVAYQGYHAIAHNGGIPGFSTFVSFFPREGLGVAVLINGDNQGEAYDDISLRVIGDALGLSRDFTSKANFSPPQRKAPLQCTTVKPIEMQSAPTALQKYTGTYSNPGYGSFTLCEPHPTHVCHSSCCTQVLSDFAIVDPQSLNHTLSPQSKLFASWSRLWASHMRWDKNPGISHQFNVQMMTLFPEGYGDDKTPFEYLFGAGLAEFVVENGIVIGFGVYGVIGDLTKSREDTVQGQTEVWFDKIS